MANLVDLDELALRCRDEQARRYIDEAVRCYKAGAYRSCIVSTWNAVVFDFLHKLSELDLTGDANARKRIGEFEAIRAGGEASLRQALEFERNIIEFAANEFELLTPLEKIDIKRLHDDRNRCAHPSMQSPEDPYQPSAELARTHLRNSVEILLQREPVQGKAALDRIIGEIKSKYFPEKIADAIRHFQSGPLRRARPALVRNLLIVLCKNFLRESLTSEERRCHISAVAAINEMYRRIAEKVFQSNISSIMRDTADDKLFVLVGLCHRIRLAWESLDEGTKVRLEKYVVTVTGEDLIRCLAHATGIPELKDRAFGRVGTLSGDDLAKLIAVEPRPEYIPFAIPLFARSGGFRIAERLGATLIMPLAPHFRVEQLKEILEAVQSNGQIWDAGGMRTILAQLFIATAQIQAETVTLWQNVLTFLKDHLAAGYDELEANMVAASMWPIV